MKIKISKLNSNPFKKEINQGKLNKEIIDKIKANIKELGLMGSLPIFKKDDKYYLIAGHHRLEALRQAFGKNFEVEVTLHKYSDENVLRGMVVENLTQRADELIEVTENLNAIRNFLKLACPPGSQAKKKDKKGELESGSARDISNWLNKNGEVMSKSKIQEYLRVFDNLDEDLLKKATRIEGGIIKKDEISIKEASMLSKLDKKIQKPMKHILDKTGLDKDGKGKLVTEFLNSSKEKQAEVLSGDIPLAELPIENLKADVKQKVEEERLSNKGKIIVTHYAQYKREAENRIARTNELIMQTCTFLAGLDKSSILLELDLNVGDGIKFGELYNKYLERIREKQDEN